MVKNMKNTFSNYRAGDFLIRVKNASMAGKIEVSLPSTKLVHSLAKSLKDEGYLSEVKLEKGMLTVKVAQAHKKPVLMDLKVISKPGLRVYKSVDEIKARKAESSMLILLTSKGVLSDKKAMKENVGGEVVAEII